MPSLPVKNWKSLFERPFYNPTCLIVVPNGLVRRQIIEEVLSVHQAVVGPKVITFGRLEEKLSSQLGDAPIDRWLREFELNALAPELWDPLGLPGIPEPKLTAELADRLGDGLDRLRLAGVSWDQLESLEPIDLAMNMSRVGRLYEKWLGPRDDIFSRRIKLLKALKEKTIKPFKILHQIQTIFCAHSQRLSPFEAELLKALAVHYDVDLRLYAPSWLIAEKITRSSYHRLALIKDLEANAPDRLSITFIEQDDNPNTELPDALRFASDNLLGPPIEGLAPDLSDELTILEAPTLYHEVEEIGRRLKAAIISGISPHRLAVAVPSLGAYLPAIEDVSRRFGLSFDFVKGAPLSEQPPVLAFLDLLSLWGSNWELSRLLKVIESPYFDFKIAKSPRYELLKAGILDDRASGGLNYNFEKIIDPSLRQAIKPAADIYAGLKASEAYLNQASSWKDFRDGLQSILINYGWPGLNAPESGALGRFTNQQSSDAIATANFAQVLIKLFDAMTISPEAPKVSMSSFKLWLNKALAREVVAESYGSGGIVLSSYYDLHGTFFEGLFLMGLNDRVFPSGKAENCWWPKAFVDGLATSFLGRRLWSDSAESYQREEELVASSLAQAKKVVLSYRAQDDNKRPSLPSPIIESLKGLWPEGQLAAEKISWPLPPPASRVCDPLELWLNLAINKPETNAPEEFLFLSNLGDSAASLWRSINDRRARTNLYETKITPAALNSWLDHQGRHQNLPVVTVSKFTAYQECHRRFWLTDILGLEPWPVPTDRWTPDIWGDVIHQTLERFLGPKLGVDGRDLNLTLLHYHFLELANRKACYRPTGRLPVWQAECQKYLELLKSWFERQPNPLVGRIEALEWSFGPGSGAQAPAFEINSPNGSFLIRGRVDRINRVNNCLEIVDYKTRRSGVYKDKPPEPGQERYAYEYQMILYAMAVAKQFKCHVTARLEFIDPGEGSPELTIPPGDESLFTEIWEELLSGQVGPTTDADACTYCDFQLFCGGGVNG